MKRLLVFVFALVLLLSCKREAYIEAEFIRNNNAHYVELSHYQNQRCTMGVKKNTGSFTPPIPEGSFCFTNPRSINKGDTFGVYLTIECNSDSTWPDPGDFELALRLIIDGELYERRTIYGSDLPNGCWGAERIRFYDIP